MGRKKDLRVDAGSSCDASARLSEADADLDLDKLPDHLASLGGGKAGDGVALGFDPQAGLSLLVSGYPNLAHHLCRTVPRPRL